MNLSLTSRFFRFSIELEEEQREIVIVHNDGGDFEALELEPDVDAFGLAGGTDAVRRTA